MDFGTPFWYNPGSLFSKMVTSKMNRVKIDRLMERSDALKLSMEHAFDDLRKQIAQKNDAMVVHCAVVLMTLKDNADETQKQLREAYEE